MQAAKGVGKSAREQGGKIGSFLIGKPGAEMVGVRTRYVNFFVSYVEVTAKNDRFFQRQLSHVRTESCVPFLAIRQTGKLVL